jgi:hypothetical protein
MIVYHGTSNGNLILTSGHRSRYGFPAIFASPNAALAEMYAQARSVNSNGHLYSFEVKKPKKKVDWSYRNTFQGRFRNLIYDLYTSNVSSAIITNALDYPVRAFNNLETNDIIVVFDISIISSLEKIY